MDQSKCKAIVDHEIEALMERLGVPHWTIVVRYCNEPPGPDGCQRRGECHFLVNYNQATITLNPDAFDDPDQLRKTLRHELFHVLLSPFELFSQALETVLKDDQKGMADSIRHYACEQAVINLERMYQGLTKDQCPPSTTSTRTTGSAARSTTRRRSPRPRP